MKMDEDDFKVLLERYNERTKFFLSELDRLERKFDRSQKDVWKYISELQIALNRVGP